MKIATWNVNSLTARWPRVEGWIAQHEPDVLCMQETKQSDDKFPYAQFEALGYEAVHHGDGRWNGVAIVSRVGLSESTKGFDTAEDEAGTRLVTATCGGVKFMCCYVPNGRALDDPMYEVKLAWLDRIASMIGPSDLGGELVVTGDFNVAPTDADVWDPAELVGQTHVSEPERQRVGALTSLGLVDVFQQEHPDGGVFSWWDYRNGAFHRGWGMRIDLVLCSAPLAAKVTSTWIDRDARKGPKPSDHAPVVVEIATGSPAGG